jgi:hypothetical protein
MIMMQMLTFRRGATLCMVALGCVLGCGQPQPQLVRVEGAVTLDGEPLRAGTVVMVSEDDPKLGEARSLVDDKGRFTMVHDAFPRGVGVPVGRYRLAVVAFRGQSGDVGAPTLMVPAESVDPQTSGLVLDVTAGSAGEEVTIALKTSGGPGSVLPRTADAP